MTKQVTSSGFTALPSAIEAVLDHLIYWKLLLLVEYNGKLNNQLL